MTGDQWAQIIPAFFAGLLALMAAFPAFYLAIRSANKPVVSAVESIAPAITDAAVKTAESISENTQVLKVVEVNTNSNLKDANTLSDKLREDAVALAASAADMKRVDYQALLVEVEALRIENVRLATASPPRDTPTQGLRTG